MLLKTYEFIRENLHLLEIDLENGEILNRNSYMGNGYKKVSLGDRDIEVHKIIGVALYDRSVVNKVINHINGVKTDNRGCNLEVVTQKRNVQHAYELGLINQKLNEKKVRTIKEMLMDGFTHLEIAKKFSVNENTIYKIHNGITWAHVNIGERFDYSKKVRKINLTEYDLNSINEMYQAGSTQSEIAVIYGCSQTTIGKIINKTHRFKGKGDFIVRKKFTTTLDVELIKTLKLKAVTENTDVSKIIEKTLKELLKNDEKHS